MGARKIHYRNYCDARISRVIIGLSMDSFTCHLWVLFWWSLVKLYTLLKFQCLMKARQVLFCKISFFNLKPESKLIKSHNTKIRLLDATFLWMILLKELLATSKYFIYWIILATSRTVYVLPQEYFGYFYFDYLKYNVF